MTTPPATSFPPPPRTLTFATAPDRPAAEPVHHGDHNSLLDRTPPLMATAEVDAIIVPTARPDAHLQEAIRLALELGSTLVVLCSKHAHASHARRRARDAGLYQIVAIDAVGPVKLPAFDTSTLLAGTRFARPSDTSLKRNIGLALARMSGWQRIVFLDDDIVIERTDDLRDAAALLAHYNSVGLANAGFPDNSVVCHAYRSVGGKQSSFIGGGALAVSGKLTESFFPNIYNEDWFFLLDREKIRATAVTGKSIQFPFDPYRDPRRARAEELGDTLAEGIFWLLDEGSKLTEADPTYWAGFLGRRRAFLAGVEAKLHELTGTGSDPELDRKIAAVKGARGRQAHITPELCTEFVRAWQADRKRWRRFITALPAKTEMAEALVHLGVVPSR